MSISLTDPTLEHLIAQMQAAMAQFVNGDAAAFKALWSHQPDVTIFGGWGAYEQGWEAVGPRLDWAAARYIDGEVTCETLSRGRSGDLAYTVWLEHSAGRLIEQEERAPIVLRVTHLFRREAGAWRIVHRHADPVLHKTEPAAGLQR